MEDLVLHYHQIVGFRNNKNARYFCHEKDGTKFTVDADHPYLKIQNNGELLPNNREFYIINQKTPESKEPITFGSQISIVSRDGLYLVANSQGELKLESRKFDENAQAFSKYARWTVIDANNLASRGQVHVYDDVAFKSPYGSFLIREMDETVSASGPNAGDDSSWKILKANMPFIPEWMILRPFISDNYLLPKFDNVSSEKGTVSSFQLKNLGDEAKSLGTLPYLAQEYTLIEDILYVMMSIDGTYIKRNQNPLNKSKFKYVIEPHLESPSSEISLTQLVNKILPVCEYHDELQIYINIHSRFEYGLTSQALCAAIKQLLREYVLLINQLDTEFIRGELTLQKLWFYIQPSLKIMENLAVLTREIGDSKGGSLLGKIHKLMKCCSDTQTKQVYAFLLSKAFVPYCYMLSKWIYYGIIEDTYDEFMIRERRDISKDNISKDFNDQYWEKRLTLREDQIPEFLAKLDKDILLTGKYLNVILECDRKIDCPFSNEIVDNYDLLIQNLDFFDPIKRAYTWANDQLMNMIIEEQDLMNRLKSIKHYFFMDIGDFFVHFLDSAEDELSKGVKFISREKLESLLEMSLRTSSANNDQYKEDVTCELHTYTLTEELFAIQNVSGTGGDGYNFSGTGERGNIYTPLQNIKGLEAFSLDYKVKWPLNIILSKKALTKYQLLFRHLFYCKYVERQLCDAWLLHQSTKELSLQRSMTYSYWLTQRMIHFSKNLIYNMTFEVLEQKWIKFEASLNKAQNFDEIIKNHNTYLDECLKESLLLDPNLVKILSKINSSCLIYAKSIQSFTQNMKIEENYSYDKENLFDEAKDEQNPLEKRKFKIQKASTNTKKIMMEHSYMVTIQKFTKSFDNNLREFMNHINTQFSKYNSHLINLLSRLDYDGFYSTYLWNNSNR